MQKYIKWRNSFNWVASLLWALSMKVSSTGIAFVQKMAVRDLEKRTKANNVRFYRADALYVKMLDAQRIAIAEQDAIRELTQDLRKYGMYPEADDV